MSKKLEFILSKAPPATVSTQSLSVKKEVIEKEEMTRVVARIPVSLKNEIKKYTKNNKGATETTLILRGLKSIGLSVKDEWLIDKRTLR